MKKKKVITTKKNIRWKIIDTIVYSSIIIINVSGFVTNFNLLIENFRNYKFFGILITFFGFVLIYNVTD